jgi:predicted Zn-dependent protease with MMP-like domain
MVSGKKQSDGVKMTEIHDVVSENYTILSNEFAKSQQQHVQAISDLQQEYLESIKVAVNTTIPVQKEKLSNNSSCRFPNTATTHMDNLINQSNDYTTDMIRWINNQNQLMLNATEACKKL